MGANVLTTIRRPSSPDPRILEQAGEEMAALYGFDSGAAITWQVGPRIDRPRSTLFPLRASRSGEKVTDAFYKTIPLPPPDSPDRRWQRLATTQAGMARGPRLERRFAELADGEGIAFSRTLTVDPEHLTTVTLAVPGEHFGKSWRHLVTEGRRSMTEGWLYRVGRAARLIEECADAEIDPSDDEMPERVARRIERVRGRLSVSAASRIEDSAAQLLEEALGSDQPMAFAHGDLSPTNLLVSDRLGVIDFAWMPRLRGFDVAHFAFRFEYDTVLPKRWTDGPIQALVKGYGAPDVVGSPAWRLVRLSMLLKIVLNDSRRWYDHRRNRVLRALEELEAY